MRLPHPHRRGFSLVELLAAITVVSILVAVAAAALVNATDSGKRVRCASNLRLIGSAFITHAGDHDGHFPLGYDRSLGTGAENNWMYYIAQYFGASINDWTDLRLLCEPGGALGCLMNDSANSDLPNPWLSYKMTDRHRQYLASNGQVRMEGNRGLSVSLIRNPANSILVAEGQGNPVFRTYHDMTKTSERYHGLRYPHGGNTNVLFADGHVAIMSPGQMEDRWFVIYNQSVGAN